jgi:hypothetical protein
MTRYSTGSSWVDVGSGGWEDFEWTATPNVTWLSLSSYGGMMGQNDTRVEVSIDWDKVPAGSNNSSTATIMFASNPDHPPQSMVNVTVKADLRTIETSQARSGAFIGEASYVSMHAVNATKRNNGSDSYWADLPNYGLTGNAITDLPPTHAFYTAGSSDAPTLEFDFYSYGNAMNTLNVTAFFGPFENYHRGNPFQYALQLDGGQAIVVQPIPIAKNAGSEPSDWTSVVAASLRKSKTTFNGTEAAAEGWHTLKVWNMVPGMVLEQIVVGEYPLTSLPPPQSYQLS